MTIFLETFQNLIMPRKGAHINNILKRGDRLCLYCKQILFVFIVSFIMTRTLHSSRPGIIRTRFLSG